jgi:hypothetical protein
MNRVGETKRAVAVPAGTLEGHSIPQASDRDVRDAESGSIDRHEAIDLAFESFVEEVFHASQVPEALFTDRADEGDAAFGQDVRSVHRSNHRHHDSETPAIVPNPRAAHHRAFALHANVGPFRENGVEMRGENKVRTRLAAGTLTEHVSNFVDADVLQPGLAEQTGIYLGPFVLFERRRLDFTERDLFVERLHFDRTGALDRSLDWRLFQERCTGGRRVLLGNQCRWDQQRGGDQNRREAP